VEETETHFKREMENSKTPRRNWHMAIVMFMVEALKHFKKSTEDIKQAAFDWQCWEH
jgi:predicted methyltransferase